MMCGFNTIGFLCNIMFCFAFKSVSLRRDPQASPAWQGGTQQKKAAGSGVWHLEERESKQPGSSTSSPCFLRGQGLGALQQRSLSSSGVPQRLLLAGQLLAACGHPLHGAPLGHAVENPPPSNTFAGRVKSGLPQRCAG